MQLKIAERADFLQVATQIYSLWSAGLTKTDYRYLLWNSYYQPWARRNNDRLVYKSQEEVVTSCKVGYLPLLMRGKHYKVMALGALYTATNWRGQKLATNLLRALIERAKQENIDGLIISSAIDSKFYAALGFILLGSLDFEINPKFYSLDESKPGIDRDISIEFRSAETLSDQDRTKQRDDQRPIFRFSSFSPWLNDNEISELVRCHNRWLARQPYGIIRDNNYFAFQLAKFLYVANYSKNSKSNLSLTILKYKEKITGYAITECSGTSMRILELIGNENARAHLWQSLIERAQKMNLIRICGYEAGIRDFIPSCRLDSDLLRVKPYLRPTQIRCYHRFWNQPMFLPINKDLEMIANLRPCPLLEFDYF